MGNNMMVFGFEVFEVIVVTIRFPPASSVKDNGVADPFIRRSRLNVVTEDENEIEELSLIQRDIANAPFFNGVFSGIEMVLTVVAGRELIIIGMDCFCC
jgi:hypothetical protein